MAPLPATQAFGYDANGNRLSLTENGTPYSYTVETQNPLLVLAPVGSPDTELTSSIVVTQEQFQWTLTMPVTPGEYEFPLFDRFAAKKVAHARFLRLQHAIIAAR